MQESLSLESNRFSGSQEILRIYESRRLITAITTARYLSLFLASSIQSTPSQPTSRPFSDLCVVRNLKFTSIRMTIRCRLSVIIYSIYSQPPSVSGGFLLHPQAGHVPCCSVKGPIFRGFPLKKNYKYSRNLL